MGKEVKQWIGESGKNEEEEGKGDNDDKEVRAEY